MPPTNPTPTLACAKLASRRQSVDIYMPWVFWEQSAADKVASEGSTI